MRSTHKLQCASYTPFDKDQSPFDQPFVPRAERMDADLANVTLALVVAMLLANITYWLFPNVIGTYVGGFSLSAMTETLHANIEIMPWWQVAGAIALSSIPLLILAKGLLALRSLFLAYSKGEYFSAESALLLGKVGKSVAAWVPGAATNCG